MFKEKENKIEKKNISKKENKIEKKDYMYEILEPCRILNENYNKGDKIKLPLTKSIFLKQL